MEWKIRTKDGPDGEVTVSKSDYLDVCLAIDLKGENEYLAIYLTAKETRRVVKALINSIKD